VNIRNDVQRSRVSSVKAMKSRTLKRKHLRWMYSSMLVAGTEVSWESKFLERGS
jgi:hypothetical protein